MGSIEDAFKTRLPRTQTSPTQCKLTICFFIKNLLLFYWQPLFFQTFVPIIDFI
jgi:hypothetical protein